MNTPIELNPSNVQPEFHPLIPLAQRWGISDDLERELAIERASPIQVEELKAAVAQYDHHLDAWLAGDDTIGPNYSKEYIAFSAMRMAADYV